MPWGRRAAACPPASRSGGSSHAHRPVRGPSARTCRSPTARRRTRAGSPRGPTLLAGVQYPRRERPAVAERLHVVAHVGSVQHGRQEVGVGRVHPGPLGRGAGGGEHRLAQHEPAEHHVAEPRRRAPHPPVADTGQPGCFRRGVPAGRARSWAFQPGGGSSAELNDPPAAETPWCHRWNTLTIRLEHPGRYGANEPGWRNW